MTFLDEFYLLKPHVNAAVRHAFDAFVYNESLILDELFSVDVGGAEDLLCNPYMKLAFQP